MGDSDYNKYCNLNMTIGTAKSLGIKAHGLTYESFMSIGYQTPLVMDFVRQLIRLWSTKKIKLINCPEIITLRDDDESIEQINKLSAESILIRWINHLLK